MRIPVIVGCGLSAALMVGSAVYFAGYVANGIIYGNMVGLRGREPDLRTASLHGLVFLLIAAVLQIAAASSVAAWVPRKSEITRSVLARLAVGLAISIAATAVLFLIFLRVNRTLRLI